MKKSRIIVPFLAVFPLMLSSLTGCSPDAPSKETTYLSATNIQFNKNGEYTTTLSGMDLSNVKKSDISITYFTRIGYTEIKNVQIQEVTAVNKDLKVTFLDSDPYNNAFSSYSAYIVSKNAEAIIDIDDAVSTIEAEEKFLSPFEYKHEIILHINGGEFENNIEPEYIYLDGGASDLEVVKVESNSNTLKINLNGLISKNKAGVYDDAVITLSPRAIKNTSSTVSTTLEILDSMMCFDISTFKKEGNEYFIDLHLGGYPEELITKEVISFEHDVTVRGVTFDKPETATLALDIKASTINEASDLIHGQVCTIGRHSIITNIVQASFYPNVDFIEKVSDNYIIHLELFAEDGTFSNDFDVTKIVLGKGIKDAEIKNFKLVDDKKAKIDLVIPAVGAFQDKFVINGEITLKVGSLVNEWGLLASESSYLRSYNYYPSLKTDVEYDAWQVASQGTSLVGTFMAESFGVTAGQAGGALGTVVSVCRLFSEIAKAYPASGEQPKDDFDRVQDAINQAKDELVTLLRETENRINNLYRDVKQNLLLSYISSMTDFKRDIMELLFYSQVLDSYYKTAFEVEFDDMPTLDSPTDVWVKYQNDVVNYVKEESENGNDDYYNYRHIEDKLHSIYARVNARLKLHGVDNPLETLEILTKEQYNFDSQNMKIRRSLRGLTVIALNKSLCHILLFNNYNGTDDSYCGPIMKSYEESKKTIDALPFIDPDKSKQFERIFFYPSGQYIINTSNEYKEILSKDKNVYNEEKITSGGTFALHAPYTREVMDYLYPMYNISEVQLEDFKSKMTGTLEEELTSAHILSDYIGFGKGLLVGLNPRAATLCAVYMSWDKKEIIKSDIAMFKGKMTNQGNSGFSVEVKFLAGYNQFLRFVIDNR